MRETMIEEVQDLHLAVHNEELDLETFEDKYDCMLNTINLKAIRRKLILLHQEMMFGQLGMFNANDI